MHSGSLRVVLGSFARLKEDGRTIFYAATACAALIDRSQPNGALPFLVESTFCCVYCEVIAEKFIFGLQISTEGLFHDGVFHCTGFADRNYTRLDDARPFMVEDGGDIPTILNEADKRKVEIEFEKAARALGIDWGPAKGDMIFGEDGKPYVIEIAARLSGGNFCYDKVPWSTGVDIVDILVDMAVGNPVDAARFTPTRDLATSQRYFFPAAGTIKQIDGVSAARAASHIRKVDIWAGPGQAVAAAENHPSRVGYVIACAPTRDEAIAAAEAAVARVEFRMEA